MARPRRPRIPGVGDYIKNPRVKSSIQAAREAGASRASDWSSGTVNQQRARGDLDPATEAAFEALENGDDSVLLPYQPTPSINPPRPRTLAAGYDSQTQTLRVRFRDGAIYEYYDVPQNVWRNFRRVKSPGRLINRTLNNYDYSRLPGH